MKFQCTCEESCAEELRARLFDTALRYFFYVKFPNRPVFEFETENDRLRALIATDGRLLMVDAAPPPRAAAAAFAQVPPGETPAVKTSGGRPQAEAGLGLGSRRGGLTLRPLRTPQAAPEETPRETVAQKPGAAPSQPTGAAAARRA